MNGNNKRFSIRYLFGPVFINWLIGNAVVYCVQIGYAMLNLGRVQKITNNNEMMDLAYAMAQEISPYTTELTAAAALIMIPISIWMFRRDQKRFYAAGKNPPPKAELGKYLLIVFMSVALCIGLNNLIILSNISSLSATYQEVSDNFYRTSFLMEILCLGVIVPISEELLYRGLLFRRLQTVMPRRWPIIISALIFGAFHGNLVQFIYAFLLGLTLAYLYDTYGSVKAPILAHMTINLISVAGTQFKLFDWMFHDFLRVGIITALCGTVGATMYVMMQRKILQKY